MPNTSLLHELITASAERAPDSPALTAGTSTLSYAGLDEQVGRFAGGLVRLGLDRGERVGDPRLATAVATYRRALHAAADSARMIRWLLVVVLIVALATALWDSVSGSVNNTVASGIYLVLTLLELFWWPRWVRTLLANADRASELAV